MSRAMDIQYLETIIILSSRTTIFQLPTKMTRVLLTGEFILGGEKKRTNRSKVAAASSLPMSSRHSLLVDTQLLLLFGPSKRRRQSWLRIQNYRRIVSIALLWPTWLKRTVSIINLLRGKITMASWHLGISFWWGGRFRAPIPGCYSHC